MVDLTAEELMLMRSFPLDRQHAETVGAGERHEVTV